MTADLAAFLLVALYGSVALHEAGHYLTARLFGAATAEFHVFSGRTIASATVGQTVYRMGWIPFEGGVTIKTPEAGMTRPRLAATVAAGPIMNLLVVGAVVLLVPRPLPDAALVVEAVSLLFAVITLSPSKGSDGHLLWHIARGRELSDIAVGTAPPAPDGTVTG